MRRKQYDPKLWLPTHQTQLPRSTVAWVGSGNLIVKVRSGWGKSGDGNEEPPTSLRLSGRGGTGWGTLAWRCCRRSPQHEFVWVGAEEFL